MGPTFSPDNKGNLRNRYLKYVRQLNKLFTISTPLSDFFYLIFSQFSSWIRFTFSCIRRYSTFFRTIVHIILLSTNPKMIRIYTNRHIAAMQNKKIFRNISISNLISYTMSQKIMSIPYYISIPIWVFFTAPKPTFFNISLNVNIAPEPLRDDIIFHRVILTYIVGDINVL